jgi:DNA primase
VCYLQGRRLGDGGPKYLNLRGVVKPMFNRDIFASLADGAPVLICEGAMDAVAATQMGHAAVGILGALSFKPEWAEELLRFQVAVVPHNDSAGTALARRVVRAFTEYGRLPAVLTVPVGKDIAEWLKSRVENG